MQNWKEVAELLEKKNEVVILSHRSPDGDSIGSSLGMAELLRQKNQNVHVFTPDPAPVFLSWMKGFDGILNFEKNAEQVEQKIKTAQLIICLDFNTLSRMGEGLAAVVKKNNSAYVINIDHHQNPEDFAHFQLSDTAASSTAQLVYDFMDRLGYTSFVNKELAECLYTGILTDTGSFRFSSTTAKTHDTVSQLMQTGLNPAMIHQRIYDSYSVDRLKLIGFALNERLNIYPKYNTGIIYLSEKDLNQFHFQKGDTEGLVNYPLSVGTIKMSILITEKDGKVKMSFRSKGDFHVNELAGKHFNGGGHHNAAGGISDLNVLETVKKIEGLLNEYEQELQA